MFSRWTSLRGSLGWNFVTFCRYRSTLGKYSSKRSWCTFKCNMRQLVKTRLITFRLASTHPTKVLSPTPVSLITTQRLKSSTAGPEDQVDEPPVKFSTSKGHKMHPSFLHKSGEERWGYAPVRYVLLGNAIHWIIVDLSKENFTSGVSSVCLHICLMKK